MNRLKRLTTPRAIAGLFLLPIFITATIVNSAAYAIPDIVFYATNDITHYDPTACKNTAGGGDDGSTPNVSSSESADKNAEIIYTFLVSTKFSGLDGKSFSALQASGALGNFFQESTMDPGQVESGGDGHGLAQWSFDRKDALFKLADDKGKKWQDLGLQLLMIQKEINASYGKSLLNEGFGSVKTPAEASFIFQKVYEKADSARVEQGTRNGAAARYYKMFKDLVPSADTTVAGGSTTTGGGACGGAASTTEFSADGFTVYNQCDSRWASTAYGSKTACSSGCGPTSMAAAITALTGKAVTPKETVSYASSKGMYVEGQGSSHILPVVIGDHWNITVKKISKSISDINAAIRAGGLVIVAAPPNMPAPFTSGGHYILIRGVTDSGKWKIADSNGQKGQENSKKEWDARALDNSISDSSVYALTK